MTLRAQTPSQLAQIVLHVAEFPDHFRIPEVARHWIACPAESQRPVMPRLALERLRAHHGRVCASALGSLASGDALVGGDEGQGDVVGVSAIGAFLSIARLSPPRVALDTDNLSSSTCASWKSTVTQGLDASLAPTQHACNQLVGRRFGVGGRSEPTLGPQ
jgi:hypothetical protein